MGEQAVPEWGLDPWIEILDVDMLDVTFREVVAYFDGEDPVTGIKYRKADDEQSIQGAGS